MGGLSQDPTAPHPGSLRSPTLPTARKRSRREGWLRPSPACSTSLKLARCSTGSALRARRRSRSMPDCGKRPALPFAYPVAVKVLSSEIAHKTDVGGVVLNVRDGEALVAAIRQIGAAVAQRQLGRACRTRPGAADGVGAGRSPDRLSHRPRRRPAGAGGGGRRADRDRARPQPAARAGRSRDRARDDRRGARAQGRSPAIAASPRAISTRWHARSWRCRSLRTIRRSRKPRSTR